MALPSSSYFTIGQVLEKLRDEFPSVAVSKIRYWESIGLIKPMRAPSGFRKFCEGDIEDIRRILRTQRDLGVPLEVIRKRMGSKGNLQRSDQPLLGFEEDLVAVEDSIDTDEVKVETTSLDRRKYMRIVKDYEAAGDGSQSFPEIEVSSIASVPPSKGRGTKVSKAASTQLPNLNGGDAVALIGEPDSVTSDITVTPEQVSAVVNVGELSGSNLESLVSNDEPFRDEAIVEYRSVKGVDDKKSGSEVTAALQKSMDVNAGTIDSADAEGVQSGLTAVSKTLEGEVSSPSSDRSPKRAPRSLSPKVRQSRSTLTSDDVTQHSVSPIASLPKGDSQGVARRTRSVAQRATKVDGVTNKETLPVEQPQVVNEVTRSARSKQAASSMDRSAERKRKEARGVLDTPSYELHIPADYLSVKDFARRSGASEQFINECADFGLVKVKKHQGVAIIAEHYLDLVELARSLSIIGIAPRHLRSIKLSVTKDFSYISQLVTSPLASRNSKAKRKAVEQAAILEQNFERFRSMVMREMLNDLFEGYGK
ncbi:MAG: MerR family transcriptional regulator [Actinomycetota bacterium]|nr:MerR family transcriptional regulator [Actinomycetota bacterium]